MWQVMLFLLGALIIGGVSWRVFSNTRSHGFFRFLAFMCLWTVFTVNVTHWFEDPFSVRQVFSWLLLLGSAALAVSGFYLLRVAGIPTRKGPSTNFTFEQTSRLVRIGPFRYIRHPLYASLILLTWGIALKRGSLASVFFSLLATGLLYIAARIEEEENLERFGEAYAEYMTQTKMFLPGIY